MAERFIGFLKLIFRPLPEGKELEEKCFGLFDLTKIAFAKITKKEHYGFMRRIVFYSWQSDHPNSTNRGFIQHALEIAAKTIADDNSVAVEPVVDRDTKSVPGSPDIASTIFSKITSADIFVADVTIVTREKDMRPSPNPNVLVELGYALKALGPARIILVFNKSFGKIEELPFDLRMRRALTYEMPPDTPDRSTERKKLTTQLEEALRITLGMIPDKEPEDIQLSIIEAIEGVKPNRKIVLRRYLDELFRRIVSIEPKKPRDGGTVDELIDGIDKSQEIVAEYSKVIEVMSVMNDFELLQEVYKWFGRIFEKYNLPEGFAGRSNTADFDYYKFIGHEMFITLIAFLLKEKQRESVGQLMREPIPTHVFSRGHENVNWEYASHHLVLLIDESSRRGRLSIHSDLLNKRHASGGGLSAILSMKDLIDSDFFLFLLSRTIKDKYGHLHFWRAWSCSYMKSVPQFIHDAVQKSIASEIVKIYGLGSIEDLKVLIETEGPQVEKLFPGGFWDYPIVQTDIEKIGTK